MSKPESPEDYLMTQLNRAYKLGQRHQKKKYDFQSENNATLVKSVKQIHEYYTNKFLEIVGGEPFERPANQKDYDFDNPRHRYTQGFWVGHKQAREEITTAIKQLSMRGVRRE